MIIGRGLLAKAFEKYRNCNNILIFASGVSNSLEQNPEAFLREEALLKKTVNSNKDALFVYFGTCSVYDPSTNNAAYVRHKLRMEKIICDIATPYMIFRLPQIVGYSSNQSTVLNFLYNKILNNECFDLWENAIRYLVDIDDVVRFVSFVLDGVKQSCATHNLITKPSKVLDIVVCIECITGKKANYRLVKKGVFYSIPEMENQICISDAGIEIGENYMEKTLGKVIKSGGWDSSKFLLT